MKNIREILFRAKAINRPPKGKYRTDYENGDWVYGLISQIHKQYDDEYIVKMTNTDGVSNIDVDPDTICEYTGMTDKNGNKTFENDIVKVKFWSDYYENYEISNGIIQWKNGKFIIYISHYALNLELCKHPEMEKIGNIFDKNKGDK